MLHAHAFVPAPQVTQDAIVDSVVLTFEDRRRRRGVVTTVGGLEVLVDLAEAPALGHGDAYELEDGRLIEIVSEAEPLLEVKGRDALHQMRLAWHLGNRHLETEIGPKWLRIRQDHVIADMLKGLGARVVEIDGPFQPEGGAYHHEPHAGHDHDHKHEHGQKHEHGHKHDHGHKHEHGHEHDDHDHGQEHRAHEHHAHEHHDHGADCGCGHDHEHEHEQKHGGHGHKHSHD